MTDHFDLYTPPGKRLSTDDPLTAHDVAERLDKAAMRVLKILMDVRQTEGLMEPVKHSRYMTNALAALAAEIELWGIKPELLRGGKHGQESQSAG